MFETSKFKQAKAENKLIKVLCQAHGFGFGILVVTLFMILVPISAPFPELVHEWYPI